jgi:squalene synthase HpnC
MAQARDESFPVASHVLPHRVRRHLLAIYGYARLVDQLGDEAPGDRLAALDWVEADLDRAFAGQAEHPLLRALQPTLVQCRLSRRPLVALIEANRLDQRVSRYETWEQLLGYCRLSANPVGELVLAVFGLATPDRIALSDHICTALQVAEHCQDVSEDLARDRVYLPAEDLAACGCSEEDLHGAHANEPVRRLLALEVGRARGLLRAGAPLLGMLHGRIKLAVAAFAGGGHAALDAIERVGFDVLPGPPRAARTRRLWVTAAVLAGRRR